MTDMRLSIIVIFHDMQREAARTLYSLSTAHQRGVRAQDYEIIAVDNGSALPLNADFVEAFGPNLRLIRHETTSVSPVAAINLGVRAAQGDAVAVIVDGARMASPGLVAHSLKALALADTPVVFARAWHLGPDVQNKTVPEGYDQATEDALLKEAGWREDGYALFDISVLAQSSGGGFLGPVPSEFSWVALPHAMFDALGGYDERFVAPGGGLVNQEFRNRALACPGATAVQVLGEGVFHQVHGGVATNVPMERHPMKDFRAEYQTLMGRDYVNTPVPHPLLYGTLSGAALKFLR
tara:strand:+ start:1345 stop:2229 length:885 start_codon:yes stop_codon:yes gene_type:complete